jgi:hypothetical protein
MNEKTFSKMKLILDMYITLIKKTFTFMMENHINLRKNFKKNIYFNKDIAQAYFTEKKDLFLFHRINLIKLRAYFK